MAKDQKAIESKKRKKEESESETESSEENNASSSESESEDELKVVGEGSSSSKSTFTKKESAAKEESSNTKTDDDLKVFVGQLPSGVTEYDLKEYFSECGDISNIKILNSNPQRVAAFITFADEKGRDTAITYNGKDFNGQGSLRINGANSKPSDGEGEPTTIVCRNIAFTVDETLVKEFFSKCGSINRVSLPTYEDSGRLKGFAFVSFDSEDAVEKAIALTGTNFEGREIQVERSQRGGGRSSSFGRGGGRGGFGGGRGGRGGFGNGGGRGGFGGGRGGGRGGFGNGGGRGGFGGGRGGGRGGSGGRGGFGGSKRGRFD
ncbi:hypothetical protein ACTFIW_004731 [Dictyostelium discoideum]